MAAELKEIYRVATEEAALDSLAAFENKWNETFPLIAKSWRAHWENLQTIFECPGEIRRVIYTTNAIESLNHSFAQSVKESQVVS